jgi:DinB superfamily
LADWKTTIEVTRTHVGSHDRLFRQILQGQLGAALTMLKQCIEACPEEHWEGKIANGTFRWVAYHTLFFLDLYLSPSEFAFELRDLHQRGGDEREPIQCPGLTKAETLAYAEICREKIADTLSGESPESLQGPSGFSWYKISRGELHICNTRHVQHHTGQLSAYLRRVNATHQNERTLPWIKTGLR